MNLVTRSQWGARPPRNRTPLNPTGATAHWEGPHMGTFPHDQCPSKVRGIQDFHMDTRGWSDIAYNAIVCPHGTVYEGRGPGVRSAANGTDPGNDADVAVCYLSGEGDPFTPEAQQAMADAMHWLSPGGKRHAHRDWKPTACPGDTIAAWAHSPAALSGTDQTTGGFGTMDDQQITKLFEDVAAQANARTQAITSKIEASERRTRRLLKAVALKAGMTEAEIQAVLNNETP